MVYQGKTLGSASLPPIISSRGESISGGVLKQVTATLWTKMILMKCFGVFGASSDVKTQMLKLFISAFHGPYWLSSSNFPCLFVGDIFSSSSFTFFSSSSSSYFVLEAPITLSSPRNFFWQKKIILEMVWNGDKIGQWSNHFLAP